jgi:uncharacterized protein (TIGR02246 family)
MKTKIVFDLLCIVILALCLYVTPSANAMSAEEEVLQVVTNWTKAMNTADFELWSSLFWNSPKTSSFAPPKSAAFLIQGYEAILKNIKFQFECPEGTMKSSHHNPQVTMLKDDVAVVTLYRILTLNPPVVKEQITLQERQTLVVQKIEGKWLIVHDHGSVLPTE